jgi:hypothetical protein
MASKSCWRIWSCATCTRTSESSICISHHSNEKRWMNACDERRQIHVGTWSSTARARPITSTYLVGWQIYRMKSFPDEPKFTQTNINQSSIEMRVQVNFVLFSIRKTNTSFVWTKSVPSCEVTHTALIISSMLMLSIASKGLFLSLKAMSILFFEFTQRQQNEWFNMNKNKWTWDWLFECFCCDDSFMTRYSYFPQVNDDDKSI